MTLSPMTRQDVPPLLTLSGAVLEAHWDRVGHITLSDRCRRPVGREKQKNPPCLIFGTRTIHVFAMCREGLSLRCNEVLVMEPHGRTLIMKGCGTPYWMALDVPGGFRNMIGCFKSLREATAVLSKTSHANCCTTLTNRPSRGRRGRFVRVVQQLACEVLERTAVSEQELRTLWKANQNS